MVPAGSNAAATAKARILLRRLSRRGKGSGNLARARGVVSDAGAAAFIVPGSDVVTGIVYRRLTSRCATSIGSAANHKNGGETWPQAGPIYGNVWRRKSHKLATFRHPALDRATTELAKTYESLLRVG